MLYACIHERVFTSACVFVCKRIMYVYQRIFSISLSLCADINHSFILDITLPFIKEMNSVYAERNLNPKAACLKRREEEKIGEDTPEKRMAMGSLSEGSKRGNRRAPASNSRRGW